MSKIVKISTYEVEFDDGYVLSSDHSQECCESHYLWFRDIALNEVKDLDFDLSSSNWFRRIENYGIVLISRQGITVKVPGYASNNGYYSADLFLVLRKGKEERIFDISWCQIW